MSPAPHPPSRSPPALHICDPRYPRPVILPPGPRTSRSFVLAAARLRALHLDPQRDPSATSRLSPGRSTTAIQRPPSS